LCLSSGHVNVPRLITGNGSALRPAVAAIMVIAPCLTDGRAALPLPIVTSLRSRTLNRMPRSAGGSVGTARSAVLPLHFYGFRAVAAICVVVLSAVFLCIHIACRGKSENGHKRRRTYNFKVKRSHISPFQKSTKNCVSAI